MLASRAISTWALLASSPSPSLTRTRPCIVCQLHSSDADAVDGAPLHADVDVSLAASAAHQLLLDQKVYISIAGLIGAGKSTLARALSSTIGLPVFYEPINEDETLELLNDFYGDMKKYSFSLQIHLLNKRFRQQQEIVWSDAGAIQDRSIYEDAVFARMLADDGLMDPRDYQTYLSLFDTMSRFMQRPDVIVFLDVTPEESLRRIHERQRSCESGMTLDYLIKLQAAYEDFIKSVSKSMHVIRVDYSSFRDAEEMAAEIARQYDAIGTGRAGDGGAEWATREESA